MIPFRLKHAFSRTFPLATHLILNVFENRRDPGYWDAELEQDWDTAGRAWPTKNQYIKENTAPDQAILDVGCGTGHLLRFLHSAGYSNLHGLDHSLYAVDRLQRLGIAMTRGNLPKIDLEDDRFDVVIASQVLEHIIQRRRFLLEVRRVLKPGGRFFCFVPDDCLDPLFEPSHVAVYTAGSLRSFLSRTFLVREVNSMIDDNHPMSVLRAVCEKPA